MRLRQELQEISKRLDALTSRLEEVATPPRLLSMARAARSLGIGQTKLAELIRRKVVRTVKLGERRMVPLSEVIRVATVPETSRFSRPGPDMEPSTGRAGADEVRARLAKI